MKLLLINHYAGSVYHGMEFRPYYMAREWVKMGHEVTIVAATFSHVRQKNPEITSDIETEWIDGIRYLWIKTPSYEGNGFGRIKNMLCFIRKLYKYVDMMTENFVPDAVIASSTYPLDIYPAEKIARKFGAKLVFELHDLWPMSPMVLGNMPAWHPFIWVMQRAEDHWCRNTDLVVSFLPDAYKHLVTRGMPMGKYIVITNGVSPDEWGSNGESMPEEHVKAFAELRGQKKFIALYLGGHGVSNGLDFLMDAAENFSGNERLHLVLIGKGPEKARLEKQAAALGLTNVTFLPPVPKKTVPHTLCAADVLTLCVPDTPLTQYGIAANKIFDYMMAAKSILWAASVSKDPVAASGCGITVSPNDAGGFAEKMEELAALSRKERDAMGERGKEYVEKHYTYPVLAKEFIDALER